MDIKKFPFVKKIFFIAASAFLVKLSLNLFPGLSNIDTKSPVALFFLAFLINLFITGVFAFAGFALPTQKLMPPSYYKIRKARKLKKYFKILKVNLFRNFLLATFWREKNQQKSFFDGTREGIAHMETETRKAEFGHLIPAILISITVIYLIVLGQYLLAAFTLFLNIIGNIYPVILQRHHRMRIAILQRRMETKQN